MNHNLIKLLHPCVNVVHLVPWILNIHFYRKLSVGNIRINNSGWYSVRHDNEDDKKDSISNRSYDDKCIINKRNRNNKKRNSIYICKNYTHRYKNIFTFIFTSFSIFSLLTFLSYFFCGMPFIEHALLYHVSRADHRHNFSPMFYGKIVCSFIRTCVPLFKSFFLIYVLT